MRKTNVGGEEKPVEVYTSGLYSQADRELMRAGYTFERLERRSRDVRTDLHEQGRAAQAQQLGELRIGRWAHFEEATRGANIGNDPTATLPVRLRRHIAAARDYVAKLGAVNAQPSPTRQAPASRPRQQRPTSRPAGQARQGGGLLRRAAQGLRSWASQTPEE